MAIVPSRPWFRRPSVWIGVVVLLAVAAGVALLIARG